MPRVSRDITFKRTEPKAKAEQIPSEEELLGAYTNRNITASQMEQNLLAFAEREAFARLAVRENPLLSVSILLGAPLDETAKALGLRGGRSEANILPSTGAAYTGIWKGLKDYYRSI